MDLEYELAEASQQIRALHHLTTTRSNTGGPQ